MRKVLAATETVLFGLLALIATPLWLPALIFVLWRDGTGFTRQDECEYLRRLRG